MSSLSPAERELLNGLASDMKAVKVSCAKLERHLTGDDEPRKGLILRVDRLEQSDKRRDGWVKLIGGASITAIAATVWGLISGRGGG